MTSYTEPVGGNAGPEAVRPENRTASMRPLLALVAVALTALGGALAFALAGGFPLIGIDDAAITLNYADNLARGNGFVYYADGERVEGFTSFLWTVIVAGAVLVFQDDVALGVTAISAALAVCGLYCGLGLARIAADETGAPRSATIGAIALMLLACPGFFFWQIFTMMETPLWTAVLLFLVLRLVKLRPIERRIDPALAAAAFCLPLIRPEGIAVALGLVVLAGLLKPARWRSAAAAALAAVVAFGGVTIFRLLYFGFPFPNTYYAKVSADKLASIKEGVKYVLSFVVGLPFVEIMLIASAVLVFWALLRTLAARRGEGNCDGLIVIGATVFGFMLSYAVLGGDHFILWRLLQPIVPLLTIAPALLVALAWTPLRERLGLTGRPAGAMALAATAGALWLAVGAIDYRQERFAIARYFGLVEQGLQFGHLMNRIAPETVMGVGPAGAIALTYEGPLRDMLGLNWVEMAHASPVKTGLVGHGSFESAVFWRHPPDMVAEFNRPCSREEWSWAFSVRNAVTFKGLYLEPAFQEAYVPVRIGDGARCWRAFVTHAWLDTHDGPDIERVDWSDVALY